MSFDILEAADHLKKRVRENPPLPSWAHEPPERAWLGDESLPDPRWERLQEQHNRDQKRVEDEPC